MRVSVVLCTYASDRYDDFIDALESLYDQTYSEVEIIVRVDGNQDLYYRILDEYGSRSNTEIELNKTNLGLLKSRNIGAEQATGDIVAFLDDDAFAAGNWLESIVQVYENRDSVAVGGKMVPAWIAGTPEFLPEEYYWLVGATHRGFASGEGPVRNTFGSNISFKRDVFLELGGFDPSIGGRKGEGNLQGGETELCERMHIKYGKRVWYTPEAIVYHKVFAYRTEPAWLISRAFWQGYSKRGMETILPDSGTEENEFMRKLLLEFTPDRVYGLITDPSVRKFKQLLMLWVLTGSVVSGYIYGYLKW